MPPLAWMGIHGWGSTKTTPCSSHSLVRSLWLIQMLPTHCQKGLPFYPFPMKMPHAPCPSCHHCSSASTAPPLNSPHTLAWACELFGAGALFSPLRGITLLIRQF